MARKIERVFRQGKVSPETVARDQEIRRKVRAEFPPAPARIPSLIDRSVKRIAKRFRPECIILFGSQARAEAGPDSDVDLLVVMEYEGSKLDQMVAIRGALHDVRLPFDIIVTSPADFARRKDMAGTIEWPAAREGKVMYASPEASHRANS